MKKLTILSILLMLIFGSGYYAYQKKLWLTHLTVDEIVDEAVYYDKKEVRVTGIVKGNASILGVGGYFLQGRKKRILVLTASNIPKYNSKTMISGTFYKAMSFYSYEFNVVKQDEIANNK